MSEPTNWLAVEVVRRHVKAAAEEVGRFHAASFEEFMEHQLGPDDDTDPHWRLGLESPLEAIFYLWWRAMTDEGWVGSTFNLDTQQWVELEGARYRLDFVIGLDASQRVKLESRGQKWPLIAVEVDGHGFHEKTPQQVAVRNQRDRLLQQAGWLMLHYSWSEVTTRPEHCIGEVAGVAKEKFWSLINTPRDVDKEGG